MYHEKGSTFTPFPECFGIPPRVMREVVSSLSDIWYGKYICICSVTKVKGIEVAFVGDIVNEAEYSF